MERDNSSDQESSSKALKLSYKVKERKELYGEEFVSNHTNHELSQETPLTTILNKLNISKLEPLPTLISILRKIFKGTLLGKSSALTKKVQKL